MTEERLIDLETRLSYQDESLRVLSDTVARQQQQLDQLERQCRLLGERLQAQSEAEFNRVSTDDVPPHY